MLKINELSNGAQWRALVYTQVSCTFGESQQSLSLLAFQE
jgi:hypothetical protein